MNINLHTWFGERELDFCPKHFVPTNTTLNDENYLWILENLQGRFTIIPKKDDLVSIFYESKVPYFEDPQEAIFYELVWS